MNHINPLFTTAQEHPAIVASCQFLSSKPAKPEISLPSPPLTQKEAETAHKNALPKRTRLDDVGPGAEMIRFCLSLLSLWGTPEGPRPPIAVSLSKATVFLNPSFHTSTSEDEKNTLRTEATVQALHWILEWEIAGLVVEESWTYAAAIGVSGPLPSLRELATRFHTELRPRLAQSYGTSFQSAFVSIHPKIN